MIFEEGITQKLFLIPLGLAWRRYPAVNRKYAKACGDRNLGVEPKFKCGVGESSCPRQSHKLEIDGAEPSPATKNGLQLADLSKESETQKNVTAFQRSSG